MRKSQIETMPYYFDRYIDLAPDEHITVALEDNSTIFDDYIDQFDALGDQIYAPEKWTVRDIIQHITDTERVFTYRALRFARKDDTKLPGYDEDLFATNAKATNHPLSQLIQDFKISRQSTLSLYHTFDDDMLQQSGHCFNSQISVLAIGFTMVGHSIHHLNVIKERYFPLLGKG